MDKVIVVSADCHADPAAVDAFGPYLEAKYQDQKNWRYQRLRVRT